MVRLSVVRSRNLSKLMDKYTASQYENYAYFRPSPVSIKHFLEYGKTASPETSFFFLRKEIPIRLANMMKEIELLPDILLSQYSAIQIQDNYISSFQDMLRFEHIEKGETGEEVHVKFSETLQAIRSRHLDTVPTMAEAVISCKDNCTPENQAVIQTFLNRLYISRISIHMLIHQYSLLFGKGKKINDPNFVGCIDRNLNVSDMIHDAYNSASFLCEQGYMDTAELNLKVINTITKEKSDEVRFSYIPAHLHYILFELFKNALRATVETHQDKSATIPPLNVLVTKSPTDITIKVSDFGGGISRDLTETLFQYNYSTAPKPDIGHLRTHPTSCDGGVMAGLGYGLPLSRLYARYFHGDLVLVSTEGVGTDVTVYLRTLAKEAHEILPVYEKDSLWGSLKTGAVCDIWTDPSASLSVINHPAKRFVRDKFILNRKK